MDVNRTTVAIQGFLDELAGVRGDTPAEPIVRDLLDRAVRRLDQLCAGLLHRSYPRLKRPPLNLRPDEMLSAVVERLNKALQVVRPGTVRQFFALANRHMRWELNDLARRLDEEATAVELEASNVPAPESSGNPISGTARRILEAIDVLPEEEREVFDIVRIQGMSHSEAAELIGVSSRTVERRLHRGIVMLSEKLGDLRPPLPERPGEG